MFIPIVYRIEIVDKRLLHAVYTTNLSVNDAAKLQKKMRKKYKINLIVTICGAALFFLGIIFPLILMAAGGEIVATFADNHISIFVGFLIAGFIGLLAALFSMNKCFGVAGTYLKALKIAYKNLPDVIVGRGDNSYAIMGEYNPKEYSVNRRDKALLESIRTSMIDQTRVRGLLNYAISNRSQNRSMTIFSLIFGILMLSGWAYLNTYSIQVLDGSADRFISMLLLICGIIVLLSCIRLAFSLKTNCAYIEAIEEGYQSFFDANATV